MVRLRRLVCGGLLAAALASAAGCQLFHDLQPHRLRRLNYGPGMSSEAYFSVPDRPPEETVAARRGPSE